VSGVLHFSFQRGAKAIADHCYLRAVIASFCNIIMLALCLYMHLLVCQVTGL
jgi:hypothetical protein